jgi:hypothetical protein
VSPRGPNPRQIALIAKQEGADRAAIGEALRRMAANPRVRRGEVRSPAAFFRGIVRGVLADQNRPSQAQAPKPPPQTTTVPLAPPPARDRTPGRMVLRAADLLRDGATLDTVRRALRDEFPNAPADLVEWAVTIGPTLRQALVH